MVSPVRASLGGPSCRYTCVRVIQDRPQAGDLPRFRPRITVPSVSAGSPPSAAHLIPLRYSIANLMVTIQPCGGRLLSWGRLSSLPVMKCQRWQAGDRLRYGRRGAVSSLRSGDPRPYDLTRCNQLWYRCHRACVPGLAAPGVLRSSQYSLLCTWSVRQRRTGQISP
jgi:hypothetical protein